MRSFWRSGIVTRGSRTRSTVCCRFSHAVLSAPDFVRTRYQSRKLNLHRIRAVCSRHSTTWNSNRRHLRAVVPVFFLNLQSDHEGRDRNSESFRRYPLCLAEKSLHTPFVTADDLSDHLIRSRRARQASETWRRAITSGSSASATN